MVTWKQWKKSRQAWWCTPVTPALGKLAEENCWSGVLSVKRQTTRAPNLSKAAGRIFRTAGGKDIHLFLTSPPGSANNVPVRSHTEAIRASQQDRDFLLVGLDHLCRALLRNVPLSRNAPPSRILGLFICTEMNKRESEAHSCGQTSGQLGKLNLVPTKRARWEVGMHVAGNSVCAQDQAGPGFTVRGPFSPRNQQVLCP
ncbi:uncharacterized protein [Alexandromys fortis]|uniref:uncharacterized protein isoform X3 n=1 Tax=Alexandromys fortis TaxID=100897 RepID=UPI0021528D98|nr:uncharacterized protein LOC126512518 isoform X3 [Microtus fortis]